MFLDVSEFVLAREEAEQADHAKSALLANISHEIRTPLNGVLGFSRLMEERLTDPQDVRDTRHIRETAESMTRILNDILDFSKIDSGHLRLEKRRLGLAQLIDSSVMLFKPMAAEKGLGFNIHNEFDDCPVLLGDPTRIQQILQNLLSNAIKFTERGAVSLNVYGHFLGADQVRLRFEVSDTGIGLSQFQQQRLFQRFVQADESTSRLFGGTGLGLSIAKGLVEQLGGEISLESVEGLGSCFSVTLTLPVAGEELVESLPDALPSKLLTVLVVDDYALNRRLLRRMLEKDGHTVVESNDGQIALEAALNQSFDLILMDIDMPVMDGYESAKAIRAQSDLNRSTYICALSGLVFKEDQEKTSLAGMDEHLPKPVSFDALRDVIRKVGHIEMA
jgi:CheY-like chemotaxis protein/anti-sigma regulatory factor (Ser/Thr protein kinase)